MTRKKKRVALILTSGALVSIAVGLMLFGLRGSISLFKVPTEVVNEHLAPGTRIRLGGLVKKGSVVHDGTTVHFVVTDGKDSVPVTYTGALPDLFREGQGVVTEGVLGTSGLMASDVLAKHDERYMPREVADALKKHGVWKEGAGKASAPMGSVQESKTERHVTE
ncbi:MAG: cytochrome c maturation protein CcmE [Beijerinckiaceae bacterium]|nr:MAG: cytochrome c maturation protein CcmE [Beijerinckiaceae bacterium]